MTDIETRRDTMDALARRIHSAATDLSDFSRLHGGLPVASREELRGAQVWVKAALDNIERLLAYDPKAPVPF